MCEKVVSLVIKLIFALPATSLYRGGAIQAAFIDDVDKRHAKGESSEYQVHKVVGGHI